MNGLLRRHWRIVVVAVLGGVLAFAGSYLVEPTFSSDTRMLIRGRDATFLSSTGQDLSAQPGVIDSSLAQSLAATYAGTATSRAVATAVVDELGLDETSPRSGLFSWAARGLATLYRCGRAFLASGYCAPVDPYAEAVDRVQGGVAVEPLGVNAGGSAGTTGSYVLEVRATGRTPDEARAVTDSVADQLVQTSRDRFATESADNIVELEDLVAQTQADLASRRDELAAYQTQNGLIAADGAQTLSAATYESMRSDLLKAQADVADLEAQLSAITTQLAKTPATSSSTQSITTGRSTTETSTDETNSVYAQLQVSRTTVQAQLDGTKARVAQLQGALSGSQQAGDNEVLAGLSQRENAVALAEQNLADVNGKLRDAQVTAAQHPSDLTRLDAAAAPTYPSGPKRYLYLALGLLVGALAGGALSARRPRPTPDGPVDDEPPGPGEDDAVPDPQLEFDRILFGDPDDERLPARTPVSVRAVGAVRNGHTVPVRAAMPVQPRTSRRSPGDGAT